MKPTVIAGHTWPPSPHTSPALTSSYRYERHSGSLTGTITNRDWVLDYSLTDNGRYKAGTGMQGWQPRPADIAHLYAPDTPYREDMRQAPRPVTSAWITFTGGAAAGLKRLTGTDGFIRISDADRLIRGRLERLNRIARDRGADGFWACQGVFMEIMDILIHCDGSGSTRMVREHAGPIGLAASVARFIEGNIGEAVTLERIAHACNVSISTLTHRYRRETGETPWQTLQRLRMDRVKILLVRGERLKEIAERTGFSDEYHLSKAFRKYTGISPRGFGRLPRPQDDRPAHFSGSKADQGDKPGK